MKQALLAFILVVGMGPVSLQAHGRTHYNVPQKKNPCAKCGLRLSPPGTPFCYQDCRDADAHWAGQRDSAYDRIFRNGGGSYRN
ncbi:MAG: hypothetical protein WD595_01790 [Waddliaceae bacterium]